MRRLEYIAPKIVLPFQIGVVLPQLRGKTILGVYQDGIGYTKIIVTTDPLAPTPTGKHVRFNPVLGTIALPSYYEPGEITVVLYQDTP